MDVFFERENVNCVSRLLMLCKMGTMVEYGVFGQETTVDWTIISDAKGMPI